MPRMWIVCMHLSFVSARVSECVFMCTTGKDFSLFYSKWQVDRKCQMYFDIKTYNMIRIVLKGWKNKR